MSVSQIFLTAFLLTTALSADAFASGFAYGANKIKISFLSVTVINVVCTAVLAVSLFLGKAIGSVIPSVVTVAVCACILILLGLVKIFDGLIKKGFRKSGSTILNLCANPEKADFDNSKTLSVKEAFFLAIALSLDGIAVGVGSGIAEQSLTLYTAIICFSFVTGAVLILAGAVLGRKLAAKTTLNLSWLSGLILIGIAIMKIL